MIFLNINIAIGILFLVLHALLAIDFSHEFKQLYPDVKVPNRNWACRIFTFIKTIILAMIPIFNLAHCCTYLFKSEEVKKKTIDRVYAECIAKEKEKELKTND